MLLKWGWPPKMAPFATQGWVTTDISARSLTHGRWKVPNPAALPASTPLREHGLGTRRRRTWSCAGLAGEAFLPGPFADQGPVAFGAQGDVDVEPFAVAADIEHGLGGALRR